MIAYFKHHNPWKEANPHSGRPFGVIFTFSGDYTMENVPFFSPGVVYDFVGDDLEVCFDKDGNLTDWKSLERHKGDLVTNLLTRYKEWAWSIGACRPVFAFCSENVGSITVDLLRMMDKSLRELAVTAYEYCMDVTKGYVG